MLLVRCGLPLVAARPQADRRPISVKTESRVKGDQRDGGDDDHRALEDHVGDLVVGERAGEAALELGNAVAAADEDEERCCAECCVTGVSDKFANISALFGMAYRTGSL